MQQTALILQFALLIFVWPVHTAAFDALAEDSCDTWNELIAFVSAETDYTAFEVCPRIDSVDSLQLLSHMSFSDPENQNEPMAAYLPMENAILVSTDVDLNTAMGSSFIVHELVHMLQFQSGAAESAPCLGALEGEAYRVQADFLEREGYPQTALTYRLLGLLMGSCAQAYHPDF